jgi:hypothetical protein
MLSVNSCLSGAAAVLAVRPAIIGGNIGVAILSVHLLMSELLGRSLHHFASHENLQVIGWFWHINQEHTPTNETNHHTCDFDVCFYLPEKINHHCSVPIFKYYAPYIFG